MTNSSQILEPLISLDFKIEAAIAHLIDNSISANAKNVFINFHATSENASEYWISILDNGEGMSSEQLNDAMILGKSKNRHESDHGKYGFGLKMATLKYSSRVCVASKYENKIHVRSFDNKNLTERTQWSYSSDANSMEDKAYKQLDALNSGTMITMSNLKSNINPHKFSDKKNKHIEFLSHQVETKKFLGIVFEKMINEKKLNIFMGPGNQPIEPWSPFMNEKIKQIIPSETVTIGDKKLDIKCYLMPHENEVQNSEDYYKNRYYENFTTHQGIYVYRSGRCIQMGGWHPFNQDSRWKILKNTDRLRVIIEYDKKDDGIIYIETTRCKFEINAKIKNRIYELIDRAKKLADSTRVGEQKIEKKSILIPDHKIINIWIKDQHSGFFVRNEKHPINLNRDKLSLKVSDFCHPKNNTEKIKASFIQEEIDELKNMYDSISYSGKDEGYVLEPMNIL